MISFQDDSIASLWKDIFKRVDGIGIEDIRKNVTMTWDRVLPGEEKVCALAVFLLTAEKNKFGRFVLIKAFYEKSGSKRDVIDVNYLFSFADNNQDALLEFLAYLHKDEKEWLSVHLYLRDHPAYTG